MRKLIVWMLIALCLGACTSTLPTTSEAVVGNARPVTARNLQIVAGQTLYVPAYSEIFSGVGDQTIQMGVTLTIHNTDLAKPIIVKTVQYYNTDGELVRDYVDEPVEVAPLATIGFIIPENDLSGGWGANFIVEWGAEEAVHEPIVEAIMVSTKGAQGISFISPGRILSETVGIETELVPDATPNNP